MSKAPKFSDDDRAQMVALYETGLSAREVGERVGASLPTVMKAVREAGVARNYGPSSGRPSGSPVTFTRVRRPERHGGGWLWVGKYRGRTETLIEARVLAERMLGRQLVKGEYVHYRDGDPYNTDEANLYVDRHPRPVHQESTRVCSECEVERYWPEDFQGGAVCGECMNLRRTAVKFGLTVKQLLALGDRCMICGERCSTGRRVAVDHDHVTGKIRGVLCYEHNVGLGKFQDSIELLEAAIRYLKAHAPIPVS